MSNGTVTTTQALVEAPCLIEPHHDVSDFCCGKPTLNDFLKDRAYKNNVNKGSKTYVICKLGTYKVIGYYTIAMGSVPRNEAPSNMRKNQPNPIPVVVLGRLAIDDRFKKMRLGSSLLSHAVEVSLSLSEQIGAAAILLHAIDTSAAAFYQKYGFVQVPDNPLTMMHSLKM